MSLDLVAAALWLDMDARRKLVMVSLCENADEDGFCWPSRAYIAARASLSVRSVSPHLKALEDEGWLAVTSRPYPGRTTERLMAKDRILAEGAKRRNEFRQTRDEGKNLPPLKGEVASPPKGKLLRRVKGKLLRHQSPVEPSVLTSSSALGQILLLGKRLTNNVTNVVRHRD